MSYKCARFMCTLSVFSIQIMTLLTNGFNIDTAQPIIYRGPADSYFGYSVAMLSNSSGKWVIVGAPRDNDTFQTSVVRPGALYRCSVLQGSNIRRPSCQQIVVDVDTAVGRRYVNISGVRRSMLPNKSDQWLGVSLDLKEDNGVSSNILVCAHRWKDEKYLRRRMSVSMNGLCYNFSADLSSVRHVLAPLLNRHQQDIFETGALGMAARFSYEDGSILMGAPGIYNFTGGAVLHEATGKYRYSEPTGNIHNGYIGYSVTSGKIIRAVNRFHIVLGAPRAHGHGQVFLYPQYRDMTIWTSPTVLNGTRIGSYFGASVCSVDVNNDGLDDLLVGSPLYSDFLKAGMSVDEGRVDVFISRDFMDFDQSKRYLQGRKTGNSGARFGSAIAALGDINKDTFNDIVIGAPYEDDTRGSLYIFNGCKNGIWPKYTQRIAAIELDHGLRAFGSAFSRPMDVDGNTFQDIAVGSFLSNSVVLLRTRPLIELKTEIVTHSDAIGEELPCYPNGTPVPCINLTLIFKLKHLGVGTKAPLSINYVLTADKEWPNPRVCVATNKDDNPCRQSVTGNVTIGATKTAHQLLLSAYVKSFRNRAEDVIFDLASRLILPQQCNLCYMHKSFDGSIPGKKDVINAHKKVPFLKSCADNVCVTKLIIKAKPLYEGSRQHVVMCRARYINIKVFVRNEGEDAFNTVVYFYLPKHLKYEAFELHTEQYNSQGIMKCYSDKEAVECLIGDPIEEHGDVIFTVRFNIVHRCTMDADSLNLTLVAKTSSIEMDNTANHFSLLIPVRQEPDISIEGISIPEILPMVLSESWTPIRHVTEVHSLGPVELRKAVLRIHLPLVKLENRLLFYFSDLEVRNERGNRLPCTRWSSEKNALFMPADTRQYSLKKQRSIHTLSCDSFSCTVYECLVVGLMVGGYIVVNAEAKINTSLFTVLEIDDGIEINTTTTLILPNEVVFSAVPREYSLQVSSRVYRYSLHSRKTPWWALSVGIVAGVVLLLVLTFLMQKVGFFHRHLRDELVTMKLLYRDYQLLRPEGDTRNGLPEEGPTENRDPSLLQEQVT